MIINRAYYPCLWYENEHSYKLWYKSEWDNTLGTSLDLLDHKDKNIFLVDFFGYGVFKHWDIKDFISNDIFQSIKNKEIYLMLNCPGHGPHHLVEEIYEDIITKYSIDPRQLIVSSESADLDKVVYHVATKYNMQPCITQVVYDFELTCTVNARNREQEANYFLSEKKNYFKKYLSFNGHNREHRTSLVWGLSCLKLLDKGLVSFNAKIPDEDTDKTYWHIINTCKDDNLRTLYESNKSQIINLDHIKLDDISDKNLAGFNSDHKDLYNQTYFSVITETNYETFLHPYEEERPITETIGRVYSEKIFRSILYQHPFIVVAPRFFLQGLHDLGYKTYAGLIDESYDSEENYSTRIYKIIKEIERLSNLNAEDVNDFIDRAKIVSNYNFSKLASKSNFKKILIA